MGKVTTTAAEQAIKHDFSNINGSKCTERAHGQFDNQSLRLYLGKKEKGKYCNAMN
jgi:hypothetical protein